MELTFSQKLALAALLVAALLVGCGRPSSDEVASSRVARPALTPTVVPRPDLLSDKMEADLIVPLAQATFLLKVADSGKLLIAALTDSQGREICPFQPMALECATSAGTEAQRLWFYPLTEQKRFVARSASPLAPETSATLHLVAVAESRKESYAVRLRWNSEKSAPVPELNEVLTSPALHTAMMSGFVGQLENLFADGPAEGIAPAVELLSYYADQAVQFVEPAQRGAFEEIAGLVRDFASKSRTGAVTPGVFEEWRDRVQAKLDAVQRRHQSKR